MRRRDQVRLRYRYFISYSHTRGFGSMDLYREYPIKSYHDVQSIAKYIAETNDIPVNGVVILNWIPLVGSKTVSGGREPRGAEECLKTRVASAATRVPASSTAR